MHGLPCFNRDVGDASADPEVERLRGKGHDGPSCRDAQSDITQRCWNGRIGGASRGRPRTKESREGRCHDHRNDDEESWRPEPSGESRAADGMIDERARGDGNSHQVRWWGRGPVRPRRVT
jgi:hypothetical protein